MNTYELVTVGRATGRTLRGWAAAKAEAVLAAATLGQAVGIWKLAARGHRRELRATVMPDGSVVVERPLHRQPRGL